MAGEPGGTPGGAGVGEDLLGTPSLDTLGSGSSATPATTAATAAGSTGISGASPGSAASGSSDKGNRSSGSDSSDEEGGEENEAVRPPSPKYNESGAFFHSFINIYPSQRLGSASQGRQQRRPSAATQQGVGSGEAATPPGSRLPCPPGGPRTSGPRPSRLGMQPGGLLDTGGSSQPVTDGNSQAGAQATPPGSQQLAALAPPARQQAGHKLLKSAIKGAATVVVSQGPEGSAGEASPDQQCLESQPSLGGGSGGGSATRRRVAFAGTPLAQQRAEQQAQQARAPSPPPATGLQPSALPASAATQAAAAAARRARFQSQISPQPTASGEGRPTPYSQGGFKRCVEGKGQQLALMCVEVLAESRGALLPDPRLDAVRAVALAVVDDDEEVPDGQYTARLLLFDSSAALAAAAAAAAAVNSSAAATAALTSACSGGDSNAVQRQQQQGTQQGTPVASSAPEVPSLLAAAAAAAATPPGAGPPASPSSAPKRLRTPAAVDGLSGVQVDLFASEAAMMEGLVEAVRAYDPGQLVLRCPLLYNTGVLGAGTPET